MTEHAAKAHDTSEHHIGTHGRRGVPARAPSSADDVQWSPAVGLSAPVARSVWGGDASRSALLLRMQRTVGNQTVQRMLQRTPAALQRDETGAEPTKKTKLPEVPELKLVDPTVIRPALSSVNLGLPPLTLTPPTASGAGASTPGGGTAGTTPPVFGPGSPPQPTPPAPLVPAGAGPAAPKAAGVGDVMGALAKVPVVEANIKKLKLTLTDRLSTDWRQLGTVEKVGVVSTLGVIGLGTLGGALATRDSRNFLKEQLNGVVVPVPGLDWLGLELNTKGNNIMFGLHLDVGTLLPKGLGFGPGSPSAIGGPPMPEPFAPGGRMVARSTSEAEPASVTEGRAEHSTASVESD